MCSDSHALVPKRMIMKLLSGEHRFICFVFVHSKFYRNLYIFHVFKDPKSLFGSFIQSTYPKIKKIQGDFKWTDLNFSHNKYSWPHRKFIRELPSSFEIKSRKSLKKCPNFPRKHTIEMELIRKLKQNILLRTTDGQFLSDSWRSLHLF